MNGYYKLVIEQLKKAGYTLIRQTGSHQIWTNGKRNQVVSTNCDSRHTANGIMKQAGLDHRF
jgi:predicted RNA binding protein YcfA (HicA-like mRNA interferase family)